MGSAYERGKRDGRNGSSAGSPRRGFMSEMIQSYSDKELQDIKDYDQGRDHGRRGR